jgi:hypothetical protein
MTVTVTDSKDIRIRIHIRMVVKVITSQFATPIVAGADIVQITWIFEAIWVLRGYCLPRLITA